MVEATSICAAAFGQSTTTLPQREEVDLVGHSLILRQEPIWAKKGVGL